MQRLTQAINLQHKHIKILVTNSASFGGARGGDSKENIDLTNIKLNRNNYFTNRLQKRQPELFLTKSDIDKMSGKKGKFNPYARSCPWQTKKQPVILSASEKKYIDDI